VCAAWRYTVKPSANLPLRRLKLRFSIAGRLALLLTLLLVFATATGAWLSRTLDPWWLGWVAALLIAVPLAWLGVQRIVSPVTSVIRALTDGAESLKDNDFSISIASDRSDELGDLVAAHNQLGAALRDERQTLFQRELLLDTVIQTTDIALVLANANDQVVYSNAAARHLFNRGRPLNGHRYSALLKEAPAAFRDAVELRRSGLFTIEGDEPQTYHLSQESFTLNTQPHRLYLFKQLTQELGRQEVATWKKVIRVISHELNNSLAPISSLAHSGQTLVAKQGEDERLATIFSTIEDRSSHLKKFIETWDRDTEILFTETQDHLGFPLLIRASALPRLEERIQSRHISILGLRDVLTADTIHVPPARSDEFLNINTPEDWAAAQRTFRPRTITGQC